MEAEYIPRTECDACKILYDGKIDCIDSRVKSCEIDMKQIQNLTISVEKMAITLEMMAKELEKQGERLAAIEAEPAQRWKQVVWLVIAAVIGAVLTFMFTHLGIN